jgi:hypothetical protein
MPNITFQPHAARRGETLSPVTGAARRIFGVLLVAHRGILNPKTWEVSEPTTGRSVCRYQTSRTAAFERASETIELVGGAGSLLYNMAHPDARDYGLVTGALPSTRGLSAAEFRYAAGGPLDAPQYLATGGMRSNPYGAGDPCVIYRG